jgi:hypothetical protein
VRGHRHSLDRRWCCSRAGASLLVLPALVMVPVLVLVVLVRVMLVLLLLLLLLRSACMGDVGWGGAAGAAGPAARSPARGSAPVLLPRSGPPLGPSAPHRAFRGDMELRRDEQKRCLVQRSHHEFELEKGAASLCQLAAGGSYSEPPVHIHDTVHKQALVYHAPRERDEMATP